MAELAIQAERPKAIVFDVDGTLYRQGPLRRAMLVRLLKAHALRPILGLRTFRVIAAYRKAQEHLRGATAVVNVAEAQIQFACERTGASRDFVAACVARWMEQEPLALLGACVQPGLREFLLACKARGAQLGVLSDYPPEAKLKALGVADLFDVVLCAQSPQVGALKPSPRGILVALEMLGARPAESLYVGDRTDVDAPAAAAAGVPCAILTDEPRDLTAAWTPVSGYPQLGQAVWGNDPSAGPR